MSMPVDLQPPPPLTVPQPFPGSGRSGNSSVGPVIGVLVVILVLGILAAMLGRLCTGRRIMGYAHYDFESWIETKCSSCIDGRIHPPPPPPPPATSPSGGEASSFGSASASQSKQEEQSSEASPATPNS